VTQQPVSSDAAARLDGATVVVPSPVAAPAPGSKSGSLGELAYRVLRAQLDAVLAHEPGTRLGQDPEELHDMRVATRRLRAALSLFRDALPTSAESVRAELRWLAQGLGAVRDLDVQLEQAAAWRAAAPEADRPAFDALASTIAAKRPAAREALLAQLDSARYLSLVAGLQSLIADGPPPTDAAAMPLVQAVPPLVKRRRRKLRRVADELTPDSAPTDYHQARIRGKRLRYAVEFVADAYGSPARDFIKAMVDLQDLLGAHQDAQVAIAHQRELLESHGADLPPATVFVMGQIAERYAHQAEQLRRDFRATYRPVRGKAWRRLRATLVSAA
jgi:triphosphatase